MQKIVVKVSNQLTVSIVEFEQVNVGWVRGLPYIFKASQNDAKAYLGLARTSVVELFGENS